MNQRILSSRNKREGLFVSGRRPYRRMGPELPEGLAQDMMGTLSAECRSCEQVYEFPGQAHEFTAEMSYCCGSDRCLP
jgi:hypothetical protein